MSREAIAPTVSSSGSTELAVRIQIYTRRILRPSGTIHSLELREGHWKAAPTTRWVLDKCGNVRTSCEMPPFMAYLHGSVVTQLACTRCAPTTQVS